MDDKKKWEPPTGVDEDKAKKLQQGMRQAAADNPVANAYDWLKKQTQGGG